MAEQTAVSWLEDRLKETYDKEGKLPLAYTLSLVEQAKQMEKEQIKDAFEIGVNEGLSMENNTLGYDANPEQYYNEKYGTA